LTVVAGVEGESAAAAAARSSARTSGCSKSQATPCLTQLPHRGWTSSHCRTKASCQLHRVPEWNCATPVKVSTMPTQRTLILRALHRRQPALDFLCERRGGILLLLVGGLAAAAAERWRVPCSVSCVSVLGFNAATCGANNCYLAAFSAGARGSPHSMLDDALQNGAQSYCPSMDTHTARLNDRESWTADEMGKEMKGEWRCLWGALGRCQRNHRWSSRTANRGACQGPARWGEGCGRRAHLHGRATRRRFACWRDGLCPSRVSL